MSTMMAARHAGGSRNVVGDNLAKRWMLFAVLGIAQLMVVLNGTVVNFALPSAQQALHFSSDEREWIVTAYSLAFGGLVLLSGKISDLFGSKWTLIAGLAGFAIASAVGGAAQSFLMLAGARALQGAFAALLAPAALSLLMTTFTDASERSRAFAIYGAICGIGTAIGLLLGGTLTQLLDWRAVMYVSGVFSAGAVTGALALLHNQAPDKRPAFDLPGVLSVSAGLFALVFAFSHAETAGWSNPVTVGMLAAGLALLGPFTWLETRVAHPLPMRVLADRNRGASFRSNAFLAAGMFGVLLFLTAYLRQDLGYTPSAMGMAFLPMNLILMATAMTATKFQARFGPAPLATVGMALGAVALLSLTRLGLHATYATEILPALLVMGIGLGLVFATPLDNATLGVQPSDAGVASATVKASQQIGGSLGIALLSTVSASAVASYHATSHTTALATVHGCTTAFAWSAALFAAGAIVAAGLFRRGVPATQNPRGDLDRNEPQRVLESPMSSLTIVEGDRL